MRHRKATFARRKVKHCMNFIEITIPCLTLCALTLNGTTAAAAAAAAARATVKNLFINQGDNNNFSHTMW